MRESVAVGRGTHTRTFSDEIRRDLCTLQEVPEYYRCALFEPAQLVALTEIEYETRCRLS